jgi:hypothetical protein
MLEKIYDRNRTILSVLFCPKTGLERMHSTRETKTEPQRLLKLNPRGRNDTSK